MSQYEDDSQEIRRLLEDRLEAVLDEIAPGWVERRGVAYLTPKGPKDLGSFTVQLRGGKMPRGSWYRFSQALGGGSVELVGYQVYGRKDAYRESFAWARRFLGMERGRQTSDEDDAEQRRRREEVAREREEQRRLSAAEDAKRREERLETAQEIWGRCVPLVGTHGDAYLQARGLPPVAEWPWDPSDAIRFHPSLPYELDRSAGRFPAVVARVQDSFGDTVAIWRIFLARDEAAKAPVENAKVGLGPAKGGAVRIGGDGPKIGIGEGLETCLAAWCLEGFRYPVWAGLSTSGVSAFEPPIDVQRVNIFPDGDAGKLRDGVLYDPPGMSAARALRDRLNPTGIKTSISAMCIQGDALDLLQTLRNHEKSHQPA